MEIIFELLVQLVGEILVQGAFELGGRGVVSIFRKDSAAGNPWLTVCGYVAMGLVSGGLSIWLVPMHLLASPTMQILNLAATPVALGFIFEAVGRWRTNHENQGTRSTVFHMVSHSR